MNSIRRKMVIGVLTPIAAVGIAGAAVGLSAAANATSVTVPSVHDTVSQLQAAGYNVIVNRVGTGPLNACTVSGVRPGQIYSRTDHHVPGGRNRLTTTVISETVYVDLAC